MQAMAEFYSILHSWPSPAGQKVSLLEEVLVRYPHASVYFPVLSRLVVEGMGINADVFFAAAQ